MRFFLVGRGREAGEVRLLTGASYATRQEALDAIGPALADGSASIGDELFVADLDAASPVVVYVPATTSAPASDEFVAPIADAWETPPVADGGAPALADDHGEDLADALRRAAYSMEATGVAAPASVPEDAVAESPLDPAGVAIHEAYVADLGSAARGADDTPSWPWDSPVVAGGEPVAEESSAVPRAEPESAGADADADAVSAASSFERVGIDEPGLEDITLLTPGGELGESFETRTVVMGEYAPSDSAPTEAASLPEPSEEFAPSEPPRLLSESDEAEKDGALQGPGDAVAPSAWSEALAGAVAASTEDSEAPQEPTDAPILEGSIAYDISSAVPGPGSPAVDAGSDDTSADPGTPPVAQDAPDAPPAPYEPSALDIAGYTCDDCVYVATCPKHHQEGPATCGSFQWKSV